MNREQITHITSVWWGMTMGDGNIENQMIEDKKIKVKNALRKIGFYVTSQVFEHVLEGGYLITRAEEVEKETSIIENGKEIEFGKFYQ